MLKVYNKTGWTEKKKNGRGRKKSKREDKKGKEKGEEYGDEEKEKDTLVLA